MSVAERLIEQTFANANIEITRPYQDMNIGALKGLDGERVRAILLVDNGLSGKKLVALTTRGLVIFNNWGDIYAQHELNDIVDIEIGLGSLTIRYELPSGGSTHHIYNLADSLGAYDLRHEFYELRQRS